MSVARSDDSFSDVPPVYTIDLSLPPAKRYVEVVKDFKLVIEDLTTLFDELIEIANLPRKPIHTIARILLRKLHSNEQTKELQGISDASGVPMYLLVAYNVLLDLFMGCTSGAASVKEPRQKGSKMMHFRTLDWGMPALRKAIAQFEFRESKEGPVIARTVNYVGYVGVLTAVRPGLSVSLNFRPYHNNDTSRWTNFRYRAHQALVLLGFRPSISAHLRHLILPTKSARRAKRTARVPNLASIAKDFPSVSTTAAYLIFCDGRQGLVLEKDRASAKPLVSSSFIAATNHDTSYERSSGAQAAHKAHAKTTQNGLGMEELVEESMDRKGCMVAKWEKRCRRFRKDARVNDRVYVRMNELQEWISEYPVTNSETHFATILDPTEGTIAWIKSFEEGRADSGDSSMSEA